MIEHFKYYFTPISPSKKNEAGERAWSLEQTLLFQRTWVQPLEPTRWLSNVCRSGSRGSDTISWLPRALCVCGALTNIQEKHTDDKKGKLSLTRTWSALLCCRSYQNLVWSLVKIMWVSEELQCAWALAY